MTLDASLHMQPSSDAGSVSAQLFPAQESSALKTLLEAVLKSSTVDSEAGGRDSVAINLNEMSCDLPTPSPKPIPVPTLVSMGIYYPVTIMACSVL